MNQPRLYSAYVQKEGCGFTVCQGQPSVDTEYCYMVTGSDKDFVKKNIQDWLDKQKSRSEVPVGLVSV